MIVHCRNTLGDGTVLYVDYEVEEPSEVDDTDATEPDYIDALNDLGVTLDA